MMFLSDQELIAQVTTKRDQRAFCQLVLRYQSPVRNWCRRLCKGDIAMADDLAQDVFIKAYGALGAFQHESKFSVWLYRIAFNTAASKWRKKSLENSMNGCDFDSIDEPINDRCEATEIVKTHCIQNAIDRLSEPQKIAIRLCFEEDLSHADAAHIMNIPLGTLKTHINRGKILLKQWLSDWS